MDDSDKRTFLRTLKDFLYAVNGTGSPENGALMHYWEALKPYEVEKVLKALNHLARTEHQHVTPAQVVQKVTGKKTKTRDAFDDVIAMIRQYGVDGARERIDKDTQTWKVIQKIGGLKALNTNQLADVRSAFYQEFDK